jgi:hypothetical protein
MVIVPSGLTVSWREKERAWGQSRVAEEAIAGAESVQSCHKSSKASCRPAAAPCDPPKQAGGFRAGPRALTPDRDEADAWLLWRWIW